MRNRTTMAIAVVGIFLAFAAAVVASTLMMDSDVEHTMPDGRSMQDEEMRR